MGSAAQTDVGVMDSLYLFDILQSTFWNPIVYWDLDFGLPSI